MANSYQRKTSESKRHGEYYTPADFVRLILDRLAVSPDDRLVDPACGDGRFLCGTVQAVARNTIAGEKPAVAMRLARQLAGFDISEAAVEQARANLRQAFLDGFGVAPDIGGVRCVDALRHPSLPSLLRELGLPALDATERLLVVGNPPYVEAKRLDRATKAELHARYPGALSGAPDLYLYFLHVCLGWLQASDRLAFVLPNKVLVNANARRLRERLLDEGLLSELWLATRAQLFPGAAVYPVVLQARGSRDGSAVGITHVARQGAALTMAAAAPIPRETFRRTEARAFFALPAEAPLRALLLRLLAVPRRQRLAAACDVRWAVSFHRAGLRERFVTRERPASAHARPFLGGGAYAGNGDVARYRLRWSGWWIDYDEARLKTEGNPAPPLALFTRPKIVICQHGRTLRAAWDDDGHVCKDTFLCGLPAGGEAPLARHPRALVGILNSALAHFFYAHVFHGGHVGGGYLHFLGAFLDDLPVGTWDDEAAAALAELVRQREIAPDETVCAALETAIERLVDGVFGVRDEEAALLEAWARGDANWRARDRIGRRGSSG